MAVTVSGHSLLLPPPSTSSSWRSWRRTEIRALHVSRRCRSNLSRSSFPGLSHRNFGSNGTGTSFRLFFGSLEEDKSSSELGEDSERLGNLSDLISVYKEAYLSGDEKVVLEIEANLCNLEVVRNQLSEKVLSMSTEVTSGKQKYLRLQADFDNYRKRSEKESLTVRSGSQREVMESLLPMVDSFEKAKHQIKPETEKEKKIDASYQGIYKQFVEVMRSLKVSAISATVGKPFDPLLHEATGREESQEFREGIVIRELRRGFLLRDQVLRPAKVKVSAGPGQKKPEKFPKEPAVQAAASVCAE